MSYGASVVDVPVHKRALIKNGTLECDHVPFYNVGDRWPVMSDQRKWSHRTDGATGQMFNYANIYFISGP